MANTENRTVKYKINEGSWTTDASIPSHIVLVRDLQEYLTSTVGASFGSDMLINMNNSDDVNENATLVTAENSDLTYVTWQNNTKCGGKLLTSVK